MWFLTACRASWSASLVALLLSLKSHFKWFISNISCILIITKTSETWGACWSNQKKKEKEICTKRVVGVDPLLEPQMNSLLLLFYFIFLLTKQNDKRIITLYDQSLFIPSININQHGQYQQWQQLIQTQTRQYKTNKTCCFCLNKQNKLACCNSLMVGSLGW